MKGDESRAEALAIYLDGGPLDEQLEPFEPVLRRILGLIADLAPDADSIRALSDELFDSAPPVAPTLETITIEVASMDASLLFYRDALGLPARRVSSRTSLLAAGAVQLQLQLAREHAGAPGAGLELRSPDLDALAERLRQCNVPLRISTDRSKGRCLELHDPDGYIVAVRQRSR